jgi:hypothetical protein
MLAGMPEAIAVGQDGSMIRTAAMMPSGEQGDVRQASALSVMAGGRPVMAGLDPVIFPPPIVGTAHCAPMIVRRWPSRGRP